MSNPRVSIAMCTYNGSKFLDEQIQSILDQDFQDFELIIIDDCSTDDSYDKLIKWPGRSSKIQVHRNDNNLGYNKNFEKCIGLCKAEFISISDQDDIWLPKKTSKLLAAMDDKNVVLAHCMSIRLEGSKLNYKKRRLQHHFSGSDTRRLFLFNQVMGHDCLFRRSILDKVFPIPEKMSYDWWLAVVATTLGTIASVPEILVHHRIHETNSFFVKDKDVRKKELDLDQTLSRFAEIPGMKERDHRFLVQLLEFIKQQSLPEAGYNSAFRKFLFSNRQIIFGHKRRLAPILSQIKNSRKYASLNFRNKGISY